MATYSTLSVINYALVLCGANTVAAITDTTPNASALNNVYDFARKNFLTDNKWTFSTTRSTLSTVATTAFAYLSNDESYVYTKPTGVLRVWEVSDSSAIWREEGDYIVSNVAGLGMKWSFDQTDHTKWASYSVQAFCYYLASEIAFQIMNSASRAADLKKYYDSTVLPNAQAKNSQTGDQQAVRDDSWERSKYGSSGGDPSRSYS